MDVGEDTALSIQCGFEQDINTYMYIIIYIYIIMQKYMCQSLFSTF